MPATLDQRLWLEYDRRHSKLSATEIFWRDLQPFLSAKGYALRPRYHPDWVPSWRVSGRSPVECGDKVRTLTLGRVMDALRVRDGKRVAVKRLEKDCDGYAEVAIMQYFSTEPRRSDPRNRCVPLLDVLDPGEDSTVLLIVTPLLQDIDEPDFLSVGELMEFCHQILRGLTFIHEHNVEHRDCCRGNLMMNGEILYPKGSHPVHPMIGPIWERPTLTKPLRRSDVSIKYYFIDFGLSIHFDSFESRTPLATLRGQDKTAPELSSGEAVDGFKLDVYCVGSMFQDLIDRFPQLEEILCSLVDAMIQPLPKDRPDAAEASDCLAQIRTGLSSTRLTARLRRWDETILERLVFGTAFYAGSLRRLIWRNHAAQSADYRKYSHIPYLLPPSDDLNDDVSDSATVGSVESFPRKTE